MRTKLFSELHLKKIEDENNYTNHTPIEDVVIEARRKNYQFEMLGIVFGTKSDEGSFTGFKRSRRGFHENPKHEMEQNIEEFFKQIRIQQEPLVDPDAE